MVRRQKPYTSMNNGGKWFAHPDSSESEIKTRETCTTTGIMQRQVKMSPQILKSEQYPKCKSEQKSRDYPLSCHDNKHALKNDIVLFSHGLGRRKSPSHRRQHDSHFSLCDGRADSSIEETTGSLSTYQNDFTSGVTMDVPNRTRRFPRNHKLRSEEAVKARAGEQSIWFGQDNSNFRDSLEVLAATCHSAPARHTVGCCPSGSRVVLDAVMVEDPQESEGSDKPGCWLSLFSTEGQITS